MPGVRQGETLRLLLRATDPEGRYIRSGRAAARVWAAAAYPGGLAEQYPAAWDEPSRGYIALIGDLEPGDYVVVADVTGDTSAGPARGLSEPAGFTISPGSDS